MGVPCVWVGERRCAALPGEWRGEYSNSIIAPASGRGQAVMLVYRPAVTRIAPGYAEGLRISACLFVDSVSNPVAKVVWWRRRQPNWWW